MPLKKNSFSQDRVRMPDQDPDLADKKLINLESSSDSDPKILKKYEKMRSLGEIFLGPTGRFPIVLDSRIPTLAFDARSRSVLINPEFVSKELGNPDQELFTFLHELGHFAQLTQDPETYLATFDYAKKESETETNPQAASAIKQAWKE